jgi:REP element-mobilizing transposase RayT
VARKVRIQYPGAIYYVMNRGDRREAIFAGDHDRCRFLETFAAACQKTDWQVHAYCLMSNHFHLVIATPSPNLVMGMKWFLGTYTSRYNRRHGEFGHLFSGRYKALLVSGGQRQRLSQDRLRLRAFEPDSRKVAEAGASAFGFSLEQFSSVFGLAGAAAGLAASGPAFGRVGDSEG